MTFCHSLEKLSPVNTGFSRRGSRFPASCCRDKKGCEMVRSKWILLALAIAAFVLPATPSSAYEEDTHFGMTYMICRSVGFTPDEALLVAAADQGVDDSDGTSPVGPHFYNAVAERYIANQWMWHAIGRSYRVIFAQRDRMFAISQDVWLSNNQRERLVLLGVFFHYQQDTWAHRRHYQEAQNTESLIPASRTSYTPYASPFGHFVTLDNVVSSPSDYHQPDRPPFDPAAALMNLEDGIGYASAFLKNVLHRTPNALFSSYVPENGVVENGAQTSPYVHQLRVAATDPAHKYLQELVHQQITAYAYSAALDEGDYPGEYYDQKRRWRNQSVSSLGDLGKVMQQFRGVWGNYKQHFNNEELQPAITGDDTTQKWQALKEKTQFTEGKTCKDYTRPYLEGMMGGWQDVLGLDVKPSTDLQRITGPWTLVPKPDSPTSPATRIVSITAGKNGAILGVGENNLVYAKASLEADWKLIPDLSLSAPATAVMPYKTMLSVSSGVLLVKRPSDAGWKRAPNSNAFIGPTRTCALISVAALPDGRVLGINDAHQLMIKGQSPWQPQHGYLTSITVAPDGSLWGVNTKIPHGNNVFHLVNGAWQLSAARLTFIAAAPNGNIWGSPVTPGSLMRLEKGASQWTTQPGAGTAFALDPAGNMWAVDTTQSTSSSYPDNIWLYVKIGQQNSIATKSRWIGPMYLTDIAVDSDGNPWGVNTKIPAGNNVFHLYGNTWQPSATRLVHIAVAPDKTVWGVTESGSVQRLAPGASQWEDVPDIHLTNIVIGPDGRVWGVDTTSTQRNNIYFLVP